MLFSHVVWDQARAEGRCFKIIAEESGSLHELVPPSFIWESPTSWISVGGSL